MANHDRSPLFVRAAGAALLCLVAACGSDATPAEEPRPVDPAAPQQLMRLDLASEGGAIRVAAVSRVTVAGNAAPVPSLGGDHVAVAYAGEKLLSVTLVRFPTSVHQNGEQDGRRVENEVPITKSSVTVFVTAGADRVEVLDKENVVVASVPREQLAPQRARVDLTVSPKDGNAPLPPALAQPQWAHIKFLDASDALPATFAEAGWKSGIELDAPLAEALAKRLNDVPPAALAAITTIGIISTPTPGNNAATAGGTILLGKKAVLENVTTLPHESAHAFANLVDDPANGDAEAKWSPEIRAKGAELHERFAAAGGLTQAWSALQKSGVELGLAGDYAATGWSSMTHDAANAAGFAYNYGATSAQEDLATYVETIQTHRIHQDVDGELYACAPIRSSGTDFPVKLAIPYAKIKLLESVGLLGKDKVTACIGTPTVESDGAPKGMAFYDGSGAPALKLDVPKAGWLNAEGADFMAVVGTNATFDVLVRVLAPKKAPPLGVHRLDRIGLFNLDAPTNAIFLGHKTDIDRNRASGGGLVLVTRFDEHRIQGVFFFVSLKNALFVTDRFAFGTFRFDS